MTEAIQYLMHDWQMLDKVCAWNILDYSVVHKHSDYSWRDDRVVFYVQRNSTEAPATFHGGLENYWLDSCNKLVGWSDKWWQQLMDWLSKKWNFPNYGTLRPSEKKDLSTACNLLFNFIHLENWWKKPHRLACNLKTIYTTRSFGALKRKIEVGDLNSLTLDFTS